MLCDRYSFVFDCFCLFFCGDGSDNLVLEILQIDGQQMQFSFIEICYKYQRKFFYESQDIIGFKKGLLIIIECFYFTQDMFVSIFQIFKDDGALKVIKAIYYCPQIAILSSSSFVYIFQSESKLPSPIQIHKTMLVLNKNAQQLKKQGYLGSKSILTYKSLRKSKELMRVYSFYSNKSRNIKQNIGKLQRIDNSRVKFIYFEIGIGKLFFQIKHIDLRATSNKKKLIYFIKYFKNLFQNISRGRPLKFYIFCKIAFAYYLLFNIYQLRYIRILLLSSYFKAIQYQIFTKNHLINYMSNKNLILMQDKVY